MPMFGLAVVFDQEFVERLKQGHEFLQATGDSAGRQLQIMAAQFGEDAVQGLIEFELVLQNHDPERDADRAFGKELVGRWCRPQCRWLRTGAGAAIAVAMITATMGTDVDFEGVAVGGGRGFLPKLGATGAGVVGGWADAFFGGGGGGVW